MDSMMMDTVRIKRLISNASTVTLSSVMILGMFLSSSCRTKWAVQSVNTKVDTLHRLTPHLEKNGRYGYLDEEMNLIIPPKYITASPLTKTGFAVVSEDKSLGNYGNHMGVINGKGELVVPYAYNQIHLEVLGEQTLIWTKYMYVNRWRFWEWRGMLFGDSFFSDAKLIDTRVMRSKIQVSILESGDVIKKKRTYGLARVLEIFPYEPLDGLSFQLGDRRYRLKEGKATGVKIK